MAFVLVAGPAAAQQPNVELMAKWAGYEVVRYEVTGVHASEKTTIGKGQMRSIFSPKVNDRFQLAFSWDQNQYAVVGTPTFANSPTTAQPPVPDAKCGPARLTGAYEHLTVTAFGNAMGPAVEIKAKRDYPAAEIPYFGETECGLDRAAAKSEPANFSLLFPPTAYFGMPAAAGKDVTVNAATSTIVITDKANGWTWTYKVSPVK
jgi:hypothetical protein